MSEVSIALLPCFRLQSRLRHLQKVEVEAFLRPAVVFSLFPSQPDSQNLPTRIAFRHLRHSQNDLLFANDFHYAECRVAMCKLRRFQESDECATVNDRNESPRLCYRYQL